MAVAQHPRCRLPGDKKTAKGGHLDGALDRRRIEFVDRPARPPARIVDDEIEPVPAGIDRGEQLLNLVRAARIAGNHGGLGFARERAELLRVARRQHHIHALAGAAPGERRAQTRPRPDDQCAFACCHCQSPANPILPNRCRAVATLFVIAQKHLSTPGVKPPQLAELALRARPRRSGFPVQTPRYATQIDPARNKLLDRSLASPISCCRTLRIDRRFDRLLPNKE